MCLCEGLQSLNFWAAYSPRQLSLVNFRSCRTLLISQIKRRLLTHAAHYYPARAAADASRRDPGDWEYSPEWMGSQGGSWGHDAGTTVFSQLSHCGNGLVTVTSHAASHQEPAPPDIRQRSTEEGRMFQEWRVLRFNEITRQSVARVWQPADGSASAAIAQADCLGMEYLKTMASAAAAVMGLVQDDAAFLQRCLNRPPPGDSQHRAQQPSALCIGIGGGSLPLFLSHHFPGMRVEAVDLDPAVLAAASQAMGFPVNRPGLEVHERDGVAFIAERAAEVASGAAAPVDFLFLDVFDGDDQIPQSFTEPGNSFISSVARALHPGHGTLVVNMHSGPRPGLGDVLRRRLRGEPSLTFDPGSEEGRELLRVAYLYRDALLEESGTGGAAWVVGAALQFNAAVVICGGASCGAGAAPALAAAAQSVAEQAGFRFDAADRAARGLLCL